METKERLLQIIQERRKYLDISQQKLAEELGISQGQYSSLISGRSEMSLDKFVNLCEVLGLNIDITGTEELSEEERLKIIDEILLLATNLKINNKKDKSK